MPWANRPRSPRRLAIFALLTLVALAGFLVDLFLLSPLYQPDRLPTRVPYTIPNTDLDPFGVNVFLDREAEEWKVRRTIEMIDQAGVDWVKQQFSWAEIETQDDYYWDDLYDKSSWTKFDRIVDLTEEYGLQIIARVDRPPAWARPAGSNPQAPPVDPNDYAEFIYDFVQHYRGRIHYLQIWNEPNLHTEWLQDAPVDPEAYVTLLRLAYERAKEADPNIQILCAPLAVNVTDDPNRLFVSELTYLEEMYQAGAAPYFDIMTANAYGFNDPPDAPPNPSRLNFRRVELLRRVMEKYGDHDKAIWFNEYGWNAAPADMPAEQLKWGRVSEEEQARWTVEGIYYAREHWPWAGVFSIWYFRQGGEIPPSSAEAYFRMVNVDFTPVSVYRAVQKAATALSIATPGWYEETAAPVHLRGNWQPIYDRATRCGAYLASSEPYSRMEITFQGSELSLRVHRGPQGGRLLVSVDGVPGRGTSLPQDARGDAYLDLYSPDEEWVSVPLVRGLDEEMPPRTHRLELTVAEEKSPGSQGHLCALDGFEVEYRRSYRLFWATAGASLLFFAAALTGMVVEMLRRPAPRQRRAVVNPWTLRPEQLPPPEEESPPSIPSPKA